MFLIYFQVTVFGRLLVWSLVNVFQDFISGHFLTKKINRNIIQHLCNNFLV